MKARLYDESWLILCHPQYVRVPILSLPVFTQLNILQRLLSQSVDNHSCYHPIQAIERDASCDSYKY